MSAKKSVLLLIELYLDRFQVAHWARLMRDGSCEQAYRMTPPERYKPTAEDEAATIEKCKQFAERDCARIDARPFFEVLDLR